MPLQPAEVSTSLTLSSEQPTTATQGTPLLTHTEVDSPTSTVAPEDSPQPHKKHWKRRLVPRNPILLGYLTLSLAVAFFFVGVVLDSDDWHDAADGLSLDESGVAILGDVSRFDWLGTHQLSVTWFLVGCGEYQLQDVDGNSDWLLPVNRAVDVYLDDASKPAFSYDPAHLPVAKTGGKLSFRRFVSFNMEHSIEAGHQYNTPLDRYTFTAFAYVVKKATNKSVPITTFAVGDAGPADFTTTSVQLLTRSEFTYDTKDGSTTAEVDSAMVFATVKHSSRGRALTFSMFAINWVLTICSVVIVLVVLRRRGEVKDGIALLPVTVILSAPTIRSLYVGSPPFGIFLDVVGFFPQMLTVLVCTMVILQVFSMRPTQDRGITPEKKDV